MASGPSALLAAGGGFATVGPFDMRQATKHKALPRIMKTVVGKPGVKPMATATTPDTPSALGSPPICLVMSRPRFESVLVVTRVTIVPAARAMNMAGICAISPSPTESRT